ncbi:uncharacterized protein si:ch211-214j8.12 [Austrofundulus limnaeus]|uniref:Uncharacterized protein si:ch211-214j8.12 n=1 Tax=Austrofundulus limnaeus TaxID=52670 RepID=A0A2I4BJU7_AUSLI|nr:PREDICTED: uncharacterized protein LOC106520451 [Austrofundulus limnaeus]
MPLFRVLGDRSGAKAQPKRRGPKIRKGTGRCCMTEDDDCVPSLQHMCLVNLADNMKEVWVKDYADNYVDQYCFRYIMGPFNLLPGELVEELTLLLCRRKQLSRPALHLLLVPQLRHLSLEKCPGLVTPALCGHIAARCQGLCSLDLSGVQQLPAKVLCETVHSLPALRSLSLVGTRCDRSVIQTVVDCCRSLRHLNVSHCHLLSPASLLPLGGVCPSSSSPSQSSASSSPALRPPLPLGSLLALDIGFGEQEEDSTVVAAYLLLSLPCLESAALEGLAPACGLLEREEFLHTDKFADRERVPRMEEVRRERTRHRGGDSWERRRGCDAAESDEEEGVCATKDESEDDDEPPCSRAEVKQKSPSRSELVLQLRSVQGVTCVSLDCLSRLCPDMRSVSVNVDPYSNGRQRESLLAADLKPWVGLLRSLSFQYPGPLEDLLIPLQVAGSSLLSLSLEGVKTSAHSPLLEVIRACPRLRDFHISAEPPVPLQIEDEDDWDLPQLPQLHSFKLSFSYDHNQKKPFMFWMSLTKVLTCLLTGSPLLEKLSLISLPCPLNSVLQDVLLHVSSGSPAPPPLPLGRVQHLDLTRTDVQMVTVKNIMQRSRRLKCVDVSHCWQITQLQWLDCKRFRSVEVVWV